MVQTVKRLSPTVGDPAAVPTHSQALLQVGGEAGRSDTATAIGADALLALPLVENLSKDVQPRLVHDLWGQERRGDQSGQGTLSSSPLCSQAPLAPSLLKFTGAPGFASRAVTRGPSKSPPSPWENSSSTLKLTKILHALRIRIIQEEVATLDSPVYLKAESQTRILDQVSIYLLSDGLGPRREHPWSQGWHPPGLNS